MTSESQNQGRVNLEKSGRAYDEQKERFTSKPGSSVATLRATAKLVKDALMEGRAGRFHFQSDEPPARGGDDQAPSPLEYFLVGAAF